MKFNFYFNKNSKKITKILYLVQFLQKKLKNCGLVYSKSNPDVVFCIGGDGTLLHAINSYNQMLDKVIFFCINVGGIGFLNFFPLDINHEDIIHIIKKNKIRQENILSAFINEEDIVLNALNEFLLIDHKKKINCDIYINENIFQKFVGTGLCISTPLGSSGYSKTFGGSIIDSNCHVYQLTQIGGINNIKYKILENSLILNKDSILTIRINSGNILLKKDGILINKNKRIKKIKIFSPDLKVKFFNNNDNNICNIKKVFLS